MALLPVSVATIGPVILVGTCIAVVLTIWWFSTIFLSTATKWPPGPKPHWLLGNVDHFLDPKPTSAAERLRTEYGNLVTLRIGLKKIVVVNDYDTIRRLFVEAGDAVAGRPQLRLFREFNFGNNGILFIHGDKWRDQRRFALSTLRNLGFGKSRIQNLILEEIDDLCDAFRKEAVSGAFEPQDLLVFATASIIAAFLYGTRRYSHDQRFRSVVQKVNTNSEFGSEPEFGAIIVFPLLAYIPFTRFRKLYQKMWRDSIEFYELLHEQVKRRADEVLADGGDHSTRPVKSLPIDAAETQESDMIADNNNNYREHDLIEAFMQRRTQLQEQLASTPIGSASNVEATNALQYYSDLQAAILSKDLLIAGMDTTANTLGWAVQLMVNFPNCQQRVAQEIHTHLTGHGGGRRQVTIEDRRFLPYTDAVLHEIMRFRTLAPHSVPHMTMSDVEIDGYRLPKNTEVWANLWAVHHDERLWPTPHAFNPESNFLERDAETGEFKLKVPKWFVAFSIGKRVCLGESLARMETFLIFANLMHTFVFQAPLSESDGGDSSSFPTEYDMRNNGLMWSPRKYSVRISERYGGGN